ncbi:hypothetical protein TVAG_122300 [Trichomonas vaginalis G3]|uniref:CCR4-Not complex component Not1 C-terminal domain-containing protein n=1 Tax=Trichomonas vaginalis (strain ATCC PRA-98 / G3) TaxID=412133 RepID=A2DMY7_TRIV3|nr:hypothetical protein TVAG_122300 [Trichomonas vaginalis G3]|eukprot:XP_001579150.1 hypothetical protein [Trichomonas vaginalis G3]
MSKSLGIQSIIKDSGYRIISNLISGLSTKADPDVISNRIILTIENSDPYLFVSTMRSIIDTISKQNTSDIHKNQLIHCSNKLIENFVNSSQFHSFIGMIFNNTKTIPPIISQLDIKNALAILVFSENTAFFEEAKAYISSTIIPKLTPSDYENLPEVILYELSNLFLPEFSMPEQISQTMPTSLSIFTDSFYPENKLSLSLSNPSLYDAVIECEPRSLISPANLERLLSFFQDFNASHAASYLTAISSSSCSFRQYFETLEDMQKGSVVKIIMKAFTDRGVDPSTIVNYLDQPNLKSLDKDGCSMLISFLSLISANQKIDAYPFVIPWNNTRSQLDFLMYIATSQTNITFGSKCRMIPQEILSHINYDISTISNGCWICIDFVERFVELARIYPKDVVPFFQSCIHKFSHVILFAISQVKEQQSKEYIDFVNYIFNIVLYSQLGSRDYFEELWKHSSNFCMRAIFLFSKSSLQKLTKIAEIFSSHLKELLDSDNLEFSLDLAFNVTIKDSINMEEFIDSIVSKNGQDILISFLQLVKTRALESHPTSMQVFISTLNAIFKWLSNHFKTLNLETQLIANSLYSICENIGNGLQQFNFVDSLPPVNPSDIKLASSEYFKQYFDGKTTLNKFLLILHHLKAVNNQLFEDMIHYPILELNYISNNDIKFATKMGQLVGNMILENLYGESDLSAIFATFHKTYSEDSDQPLIIFTSSALSICYSKLTRIPIYVFNLLKQPSFKQREPILYQNIKKISMSLSAPIQLSQTTKLNIHPKIRRFEKLQQPPPRLRRNLQNLNNDSQMLHPTIQAFTGYLDWLALHLVEDIEDHPCLLQTFLPSIIEDREFTEIMIQAASYEVYNLVEKSDEIATYEGGFKRRRLSILGRLIGNLTFALNRPILSKYIDIKRLLLYSLAHGKLFGVLPFVAAVLRCATSFFEPPNPYMSAILQVLASINSIDLLKLSIKNQITLIMNHFKVTSSQFMIIPLIPNINEDNFDFITKPFSLLYFSNQADIDKIISFEDSAFYTLTSQHFIIPEYEGENAEEKQSKFRNALTNATLSFLKTEGKNLSQVASSTASELILKDFVLCNNMNLIYQTAETLTKQLSASLVMFTVFQKQQIYLHHNVMHDIDQKDSEWALQGVQANHNFIGQLLKDVVYLKAWKIVQQKIENFEQQKKENSHNQRHQDLIPLSIQHLVPPSILPTEQGLLPQHNFIYQDLAELALNPSQIQIIDKTADSKSKSYEAYESYFQWVAKRISSETNATDLNDQINSLLQLVSEKIPDVGPNFESFTSLIRTMMKYMYKNNHRINDTVFSRILEQIVGKAPPEYVTRMQPLIVSWLRNFIPSIQLPL